MSYLWDNVENISNVSSAFDVTAFIALYRYIITVRGSDDSTVFSIVGVFSLITQYLVNRCT